MNKTIYLLESVNVENRTGVLKIKPAEPANAKWLTILVSLSGLLTHRIKEEMYDGLSKPDTFIGTKFTSTVNSREFNENPFKLVKFIPKGKSDIPENYSLSLVIERFSPKEELKDALGRKSMEIVKWRKTLPKYFMRYVEVETTSMMSSLKFNIVTQ